MLLDLAMGLWVSVIISSIFTGGFDCGVLLIGVIFSVTPDFDFVYHYLKTKEVAAHAGNTTDHRDGLHYPIPYVILGTIFIAIFSKIIAVLFLITSVWHFFHDLFGTGWGIKLFYPFSNKNYKLFCDKEGNLSKQILVSWNSGELEDVIYRKGDPEWIKNLFLTPFWEMITFKKVPSILFTIEIIVPIGLVLWAITYMDWLHKCL